MIECSVQRESHSQNFEGTMRPENDYSEPLTVDFEMNSPYKFMFMAKLPMVTRGYDFFLRSDRIEPYEAGKFKVKSLCSFVIDAIYGPEARRQRQFLPASKRVCAFFFLLNPGGFPYNYNRDRALFRKIVGLVLRIAQDASIVRSAGFV